MAPRSCPHPPPADGTCLHTLNLRCPRRCIVGARTAQSGSPYVAVFLRKEPGWNQAAGSDGEEAAAGEGGGGGAAATPGDNISNGENKDGVIEGTPENAVQQTYPEVITSLDEIHEVGTLAQVSVNKAPSLRAVYSSYAIVGEILLK